MVSRSPRDESRRVARAARPVALAVVQLGHALRVAPDDMADTLLRLVEQLDDVLQRLVARGAADTLRRARRLARTTGDGQARKGAAK